MSKVKQFGLETDFGVHQFLFSADAIYGLHSVNFRNGPDCHLHLVAQPVSGGVRFVVNDQIGGAWGSEVLLGEVEEGTPCRVTVAFEDGHVSVQLNTLSAQPFRRDKILPSSLTVDHSSAITATSNGLSPGTAMARGSVARPSEKFLRISKLRPEVAGGFIDFMLQCPEADIVIFSGWLKASETAKLSDGPISLSAWFEQAEPNWVATLCWYDRSDLSDGDRGYLAVVRHRRDGDGELRGLAGAELRGAGGSLVSVIATGTTQGSDELKLGWIKENLTQAYGTGVVETRRLVSQIYDGSDTTDGIGIDIGIDEVLSIPGEGILLIGWLLDPDDLLRSVRLCSKSGASENIRDRWVWTERPDIMDSFASRFGLTHDRHGFIAFAPSIDATGEAIHLELTLADGTISHRPLMVSRFSAITAIRRVLSTLTLSSSDLDHVFDKIIGAPILALNRQRLAVRPAVSEATFGSIDQHPRCSIIIPLYGRLDLLAFQLALFSHEEHAVDEFIYVLDQPERKAELLQLARNAFARFGRPFRIIFSDANRGFAAASNLGLEMARGEHVCFLNSDVFPLEPGWLQFLIDALRADATIGVAGARLLFPDGSIQHEGMVFEPIPDFANWLFPMHSRKGMRPRRRQEAVHEEEAITGACMVMRRALADELGGFDTDYVIGDFEDADLCRRLGAKGLRCVVDDRATMYHLERQSQGDQDNWRTNLTLLNAWVFARRWTNGSQPVLGVG